MSVVPSQILYLEHGSWRLYAEAIQVVSTRHLCWARPTLLIQGLPESCSQSHRQSVISEAAQALECSPLKLYDLEDGPDLLWPLTFFHVAFDVDFFSLLVQLKINPNGTSQSFGKGQLNEFIRSFWRAHADAFPPPAGELSS